MPASIDISNQKYNMLTVLYKTGRQTSNKQYYWMCRCDCGNMTEVRVGNIRTGRTKSCGCLNKLKGEKHPNFKHGLSQNRDTGEYKRYQRECFDRHKYNLEPEHKQAIFDKQNGNCAICGYVFGQKKGDMRVDHCHDTGVVRGLLCDLCNRGLGYYKDNPNFLCNAAEYLSKFKYSLAR
jgi:rubredoxin